MEKNSFGELYVRLAAVVPYVVLCRWEDELRAGRVPSELLDLIVRARAWSHFSGKTDGG